jgi:hypothetical protein
MPNRAARRAAERANNTQQATAAPFKSQPNKPSPPPRMLPSLN